MNDDEFRDHPTPQILIRFRRGEAWEPRVIASDRLQEVLDRAWRQFGDLEAVLPPIPEPRADGANTAFGKRPGSSSTRKRAPRR